ncbi:hypothetical protein QBC37DRAFT_389322 [Rhypophila decipiens]|uniref:Uncharacterized protein n=1 Tax=Rhypophila decipiens TaxID=261697 RepID=A0AAN6Y370_9PEZI|nr:hypothetical protein QBC37DRAFT_389322 [Rhypophila decipiens]
MDPPTHQLAQVPTKAGLLPDKNMPPSWAGRPSSFRVVVAELAVICVPYFLIRFFALPTFWLYHAPLSSLWHDIIMVPWTWIKTFNTFINSEGNDSDFLDQKWTNPVHSAIAGACYHIQSQVLGISDCWGVFDADPSIHAHQGALVVVIVYFTLLNSLWTWGLCFRMARSIGTPLVPALSQGVYMTFCYQWLAWGIFLGTFP